MRSPGGSRSIAFVAVALLTMAIGAQAMAAGPTLSGTWQRIAPAPSSGLPSLSVWSGGELLVFARASRASDDGSMNVAAAYAPGRGAWRKLEPPPGAAGNYEGTFNAVWTGREMLILTPFEQYAYSPTADRWRNLPKGVSGGGIVVWTGRELVVWGGGCCGDAYDTGHAYDPATNARRELARSPLAPAQRPLGAWNGRELLLWVGDDNPAGGTWPASLARAAAYDPRADRWRRIARLPALARGGRAFWTGREVLVVAGGKSGRSTNAYSPATDRWRKLAPMPTPHRGGVFVWTGERLLVWGGGWMQGNAWAYAGRGLAYEPGSDRWTELPYAPLLGRIDATAVWTGRSLIVWGGYRPGTFAEFESRLLADGAIFTPARP